MFIAPTEPKLLKAIGVSNLLPEEYGVDVIWQSQLGMIGIQRKQFPDDFLASVFGADGRLYREYQMMRGLDVAVLLLEGRDQWTVDGHLIRDRSGKRNGWTRTQHRNYLASVQLRGIQVAQTDSLSDTISYVRDLHTWSNKDDHTGLDQRPGPKREGWGVLRNEDFQSHILQGLPGIGPKQAKAIVAHFKGLPFGLNVTREELMEVPGIGKGRADKIWRVFNG